LSPTPSSISIIYTPSTAVSFPKPITVRRSSRAPKPCKVTQPPITPLSTPSALKEATNFAQRQKPPGRKKLSESIKSLISTQTPLRQDLQPVDFHTVFSTQRDSHGRSVCFQMNQRSLPLFRPSPDNNREGMILIRPVNPMPMRMS